MVVARSVSRKCDGSRLRMLYRREPRKVVVIDLAW